MKKTILVILILALCCVIFTGCKNETEENLPVDNRTLSLNQGELTVVVGQQSVKLSAILSSGKGAFQWTSSNEEIVTVDQNGNVTGIAVGSATVTVSCGTLEPAACQVNVVLPNLVPVFTADPTGEGIAKTVSLGGSVQLDDGITLGGEPIEAQITYLSQDSAIAAVSDTGVVTGVKTGTTQIQAVAVYMDLEVHMTVEITVLSE